MGDQWHEDLESSPELQWLLIGSVLVDVLPRSSSNNDFPTFAVQRGKGRGSHPGSPGSGSAGSPRSSRSLSNVGRLGSFSRSRSASRSNSRSIGRSLSRANTRSKSPGRAMQRSGSRTGDDEEEGGEEGQGSAPAIHPVVRFLREQVGSADAERLSSTVAEVTFDVYVVLGWLQFNQTLTNCGG